MTVKGGMNVGVMDGMSTQNWQKLGSAAPRESAVLCRKLRASVIAVRVEAAES